MQILRSIFDRYLKKTVWNGPIIFVDDSIVFQCKYARTVNANSQLTVSDSSETISGEGDLTYRMEIVAGALGGNTEIAISPNHNISGISPR